MKNNLFVTAMALPLFLVPGLMSGQAPSLGAASGFALFTGSGAFGNTGGATNVTGDIGTNSGTISGFPPGVLYGSSQVANALSNSAANDLTNAYNSLSSVSCSSVIGTAIGGKTLTPGNYCVNGNAYLKGTLVLDALGNPNLVFIIKVNGSLTTNIGSRIILINNASKCNIYWQINGVVTLGMNSFFYGNIIASNKIDLLKGATLFGRGLTTKGAINLQNNTVNLGIPPVAAAISAAGSTTFCSGGSVSLSGNSGGMWNNSTSAPSIEVSASGNYYTTYTSGCLSTTSNTIAVVVNPNPSLSVQNETVCAGNSAVLMVSGASTYTWSGPNLNSTTGGTVIASPSSSANYTVTGTNASGCTSSAYSSLIVLPNPTVSVSPASPTICAGNNVVLTAGGASTYSWSPSSQMSIAQGASVSVSPVSTTIFTVTGTNNLGCSASASASIIVNPLPTPSITPGGSTTFCDGDSVILYSSAANSYSWSNSAITQSITAYSTGNYVVTVTDANGCVNSASLSVKVNPNPTVSVNNPTICEGSTATLTASGALNYTWQPGNSTGNSLIAGPASSTSYTVTGSGIGGCTASAIAMVTVNENPTVTATASPNTIHLCYGPDCSTLTANVTSSAPYTYTWSSGQINTVAVVCPSVTSAYTLTVSDTNNCVASGVIHVNVVDACCGNDDNVKVIICHNGHEICVDEHAVPAHLAHGDQIGPCLSSRISLNETEKENYFSSGVKVYPNPFNSGVRIDISNKTEGLVKVTIKDVNGRTITELMNGHIEAGNTSVNWEPASSVTCGIYFCEVSGPQGSQNVKLILMK